MVAITGGAGKLGKALVANFSKKSNLPVVIVSRTPPIWLGDKAARGCVQLKIGDIRDVSFLTEAFRGCHSVFHLAASGNVQRVSESPHEAYEVNVGGTANVAEACRRNHVPKCIFTSTILVYGRPTLQSVDENVPARPDSFYAASKWMAEETLRSYFRHFGLGVVIARCSSIIGPDDSEETVFGRALSQVKAGEGISLLNLEAERDFVFVDDVAEALVQLERLGSEQCIVVNVSSGQNTSIRLLAEILQDAAVSVGLSRPHLNSNQSTGIANSSTLMDNHRLKEMVPWYPRDLASAVKESLAIRLGKHNESQ